MMGWHHSGFNIYCGPAIWPNDEAGLENLARYIIRACFSQERMTYIPAYNSNDGTAKVLYCSKDGSQHKTFDALDWLALLTTHIPDRYEQTVRYYGYYSNRARGERKKSNHGDLIPMLMDADVNGKHFKRSWARLIKKIYNIDPLICPKCQSQMKIISVIEDDAVIKKILQHLGLWDAKGHDPPARSSPIREFTYDDAFSQLPAVDYWTQ